MSLFGALKKTIWLPVEVVKDVVTLGGAINYDPDSEDYKGLYTYRRLKDIQDEIDE